MMRDDETISTERAANEMPTASASIDVAMARIVNSPRSMVSAGLQSPSSSSWTASQSIFPPMKARRTKAIQWSTGAMSHRNWVPSAQPISGMRPWKPPKKSASTTATFQLTRLIPRPLQMDTAKASMERPTAMRKSSIRLMSSPFSIKKRGPWRRPSPVPPRVSLIKVHQAVCQCVDAPHAFACHYSLVEREWYHTAGSAGDIKEYGLRDLRRNAATRPGQPRSSRDTSVNSSLPST